MVAVAERMYVGAGEIPDVAGWLLDEEFAFGEPYESMGEFLGDLADAVAHQAPAPTPRSRRFRSWPP